MRFAGSFSTLKVLGTDRLFAFLREQFEVVQHRVKTAPAPERRSVVCGGVARIVVTLVVMLVPLYLGVAAFIIKVSNSDHCRRCIPRLCRH